MDNEKGALGCCFLETEAVDVALSLMSAQDFSLPPHRVIFEEMVSMADSQMEINMITLTTELEKKGQLAAAGGSAYLGELLIFTPTYTECVLRYYAAQIIEQATKRKLRGIAEAINRNVDTMSACDLRDKVEEVIFSLTAGKKEGPKHVKDTLKDVYKQMELAHSNKGMITGLETGISKLDAAMCGLNKSDLTIIAGRPAMGKSALAGNIVEKVSVKNKKQSLIFSCEMSTEQWVKRILYSLSRVDGARARVGNFADGDWPKLTHGNQQLQESGVWIDDTPGINISELRARARTLHRKVGLELVVVDYLQLLTGNGDSRQQEIGSISRGLKGMAKELDIPVIALSQLNRKLEERVNKRPTMSDLRESGDIEQDADNILLLYRDAVYNPASPEGEAEIIIGKQRNGPIGTIPATWIGGYSRFENCEERRNERS
jgi:replicative DNA helicase